MFSFMHHGHIDATLRKERAPKDRPPKVPTRYSTLGHWSVCHCVNTELAVCSSHRTSRHAHRLHTAVCGQHLPHCLRVTCAHVAVRFSALHTGHSRPCSCAQSCPHSRRINPSNPTVDKSAGEGGRAPTATPGRYGTPSSRSHLNRCAALRRTYKLQTIAYAHHMHAHTSMMSFRVARVSDRI